jgi:O-antigen ligase
MALIFAAVGFYQYDTRNIFENRKVIHSNAYAPFFRVNSLFWDPSVYGRFLVVAMIPSIVLIVFGRSTRLAWAAFAALVVTWLGLLISFSQSSFAALLLAVGIVAVVVWRWRALIAVMLAALVLVGLAASQPQVRRSLQHHTIHGLNSATSGRADLVANGVRIAIAHPALGVGVGGFRHAYVARLHLKGLAARKAASHDTPVTVAAETGVVGLALLAWLVVSFFLQGFRRIGSTLAGRTSLVATVALAAILCHSLFYNAFFEDPMTWGLIGLVALATRRPEPAAVKAPLPAEREPVPV